MKRFLMGLLASGAVMMGLAGAPSTAEASPPHAAIQKAAAETLRPSWSQYRRAWRSGYYAGYAPYGTYYSWGGYAPYTTYSYAAPAYSAYSYSAPVYMYSVPYTSSYSYVAPVIPSYSYSYVTPYAYSGYRYYAPVYSGYRWGY
jgi:hypothetical protein